MNTAEGTFTFDRWDESGGEPVDGVATSHVLAIKKYTGGIDGMSAVQMAGGSSGKVMTYVAIERYDVTLDGKRGQFLARHIAAAGEGTDPEFSVTIIKGTGTGDLVGITGEVKIIKHDDDSHTAIIEYDLP